jgi:cell division protein FtsL
MPSRKLLERNCITVSAIIWLSVALQSLAAAWLVFSAVFLLMAARRVISLLYEAGVIGDPRYLHNLIEPVALVISVLLVIAVHLTRRIFEEHNRVRDQLECQFDDLHRFQQSTVGRELRLKQLEEENAALHARLNNPAGRPSAS